MIRDPHRAARGGQRLPPPQNRSLANVIGAARGMQGARRAVPRPRDQEKAYARRSRWSPVGGAQQGRGRGPEEDEVPARRRHETANGNWLQSMPCGDPWTGIYAGKVRLGSARQAISPQCRLEGRRWAASAATDISVENALRGPPANFSMHLDRAGRLLRELEALSYSTSRSATPRDT